MAKRSTQVEKFVLVLEYDEAAAMNESLLGVSSYMLASTFQPSTDSTVFENQWNETDNITIRLKQKFELRQGIGTTIRVGIDKLLFGLHQATLMWRLDF